MPHSSNVSDSWRRYRWVLASILSFTLTLVAVSCGSYGDSGTSTLCNVQVPPDPGPPPPTITIFPSDNDGVHSAGKINVPISTRITLDGDLTLVANEDINIEGEIKFPVGGSSSYTLTIVSWNGDVNIKNTATIGGGNMKEARSSVIGGNGLDGGKINIIAKSVIRINGPVTGNGGGAGGTGIESTPYTGSATAKGGNGGKGGEILLCAMELIQIMDPVTAGAGGIGGDATATDDNGDSPLATAGGGGVGGDVKIQSRGGATVGLKLADVVMGGAGGAGGKGTSTGLPSGFMRAGTSSAATANGGDGKAGGTVVLGVVNPLPPSGIAKGGAGGRGGAATATGGIGGSSTVVGSNGPFAGGNATASGGNGGKGGTEPSLRGGGVRGFEGADGAGGTATATAGRGGNGAGSTAGAASGKATATGGANGAGVAAPIVAPIGPVPAVRTMSVPAGSATATAPGEP